jgi:signal transduction histidine kinase
MALAPVAENGFVVGIVCSLRDISSFKEIERMKDAFVSNVSHELRTPIANLKLNHDLIQFNPKKSDVYMERLGREIDRLNAIIEDLLRLSRLEQGRVEMELTSVDLNKLLRQYVNDQMPLARKKRLALTIDQEPELIVSRADPGLIRQVLSILLTNALNYTPSGGQVSVSTQVRRQGGQPWVGFSVSDTGPGIPVEERPHVFERFFRGQAGLDSGAPGTGLGLSIAQKIVKEHKGQIEVISNSLPGKGATFEVWLPAEGGVCQPVTETHQQ